VDFNESAIAKVFLDADKAQGLKSLGLDVELKAYYKYE